MNTLTERLRELEKADLSQLDDNGKRLSAARVQARIATALAQELHTLLVECGSTIDVFLHATMYKNHPSESDMVIKLLAKLKQAGIV